MPMPFDTLAYAEQLKRAGFTDDQARALAELRLEVSEAKRDIETLKVGRPASADEVHKLNLKLIPLEGMMKMWPHALAFAVMVAVSAALIIISLIIPAPK